ncbi:MAG: NAD(P)H-dependent oxidoreductase [Neisseria sp.]|nr:NAD(P)H-dependent oxidoreductase [Neisseria sp.]
MLLNREQALDIFHRRVSTRNYDPARKISDDDFRTILECGIRSPSSVGSEPWKFVVLQDPALRQKLKPIAFGLADSADNASHLLVILAKKNARMDSEFLREAFIRQDWTAEDFAQKMPAYLNFHQNDIAVTGNERTLFDWASKQTYLALANMMTAAAMLGIDSCPMEGFDYAAVNQLLADAGVFDPAEWGVSVMASFGYRAREIARKNRREFDDVVQVVG